MVSTMKFLLGHMLPRKNSTQWLETERVGKQSMSLLLQNENKFFLSIYGFSGSLDGKASAYNAGDPGSIPGWGRSPGEGNGNPLQYSRLDNPMDGEAWWAIVHAVAKSRT